MSDLLLTGYLWFKAFHIISVIAWMAGLFYLPRLFIYHNDARKSETIQIETFRIMERRLLKAIMNPAMVSSWIFGLLMIAADVIDWSMIWPWIKIAMVLGMTWFHMWCGKQRKLFENGRQKYETRTYRYMNEVPTLFMVVIVFMAVVEPF
ncbi:MAG: protoporphyrinogen oxidase HemJ [Pseudomonadota bacterium]